MSSAAPQPTTFLLIRHAETIWNHDHRHVGSTDVPLSKAADRQIAKLTRHLLTQPIEKIYSSPLSRCKLTIQPAADILAMPMTIRQNLIERGLGEWEGKSGEELLPFHPGYHFPESAYNGDFRIPGAETLEELEHRIRIFLNKAHSVNPGKTIAVSTHSGVIWTIVQRIVSNPPEMFFWPSNCSVTKIVSEGNHYLFESYEQVAT